MKQIKWTKVVLLLALVLFLSDCMTPYQPKGKTYPPATKELKEKLFRDLRSGNLRLGATVDFIRSTYGDADEMSVWPALGITLRYFWTDSKNNIRYIYLKFKDGKHLSSWGN